jgi:hypothetical protein
VFLKPQKEEDAKIKRHMKNNRFLNIDNVNLGDEIEAAM